MTHDPFGARESIETPLGRREVFRISALTDSGDIDSIPYSIKVLLEKEAKRQMAIAANGGEYTGPVIAVTHEKGSRDKADPSNLPYLHKNPAV